MSRMMVLCVAAAIGLVMLLADPPLQAAPPAAIEYRLLATSKTSTMEKELNEAAEAGFQFQAVMGGETAVGGKEVVAVVTRSGEAKSRYAY
jgi:hypothetical protein